MIYVIVGNEPFLLKKQLKAILNDADPDNQNMDTVFYDGSAADFSMKQVVDDCDAMAFFAKRKVVIVENPVFLCTKQTKKGELEEESESVSKKNKEIEDTLNKYLDNPNPDSDLVFYGEVNIDKRKKIVKNLVKNGRLFNIEHMDDQQFMSYVNQTLQKYHLSLTNEARKELFNRLPNDLMTFHNEVEKLALYGDKLDVDDIKCLVTRSYDDFVFNLTNAIMDKDLKVAMHKWQDLQSLNVEPIYMLALLAGQFRFLYRVKYLMSKGYSENEIASELGAKVYRIQLTCQRVRSLSIQSILKNLAMLADLDQDFKSGKVDRNVGLEMFILKIAR